MRRILYAVVALTMAVAGCDAVTGPGPGEGEPGLWVRETQVILEVGEQARLSAGYQADRLRDSLRTVRDGEWTAENPSIVSADGQGSIEGLAPGVTKIRVEKNGLSDAATVIVRTKPEYRTRWASVEVGDETSCALTVEGKAYCWGGDYYGAIGDGVRRQWTKTYAPVVVSGGHEFAEVDVGLFHVCGPIVSGQTLCWGDGGIIGEGANQGHVLEPHGVDFSRELVQVRTGPNHVCGLDLDGAAYCWGLSANGELGDDDLSLHKHLDPVRVKTDLTFTEIEPGASKTCALADDASAHCWGAGFFGRLGTGSEKKFGVPMPVAGNHRFQTLSGRSHSCGKNLEDVFYCWGSNRTFAIGGSSEFYLTPTNLPFDIAFEHVTAGGGSTCGTAVTGVSYCWGWDGVGNLGDGPGAPDQCIVENEPCSDQPLEIAGNRTFVDFSISATVTCGVTADHALYCWGSNRTGQLGTGSLIEESDVPVRVADPI